MKLGFYRADEIKYRIDVACQICMYENADQECKDQIWEVILDLQQKLYEQFDDMGVE